MVENGLLLDTSFILPVFGINVVLTKNFRSEVKSLLKHGLTDYQLSLSSVSLIEVTFLLNREFKKQNDITILNRYSLLVPTITHSHNLSIIHSHVVPKIVELAYEMSWVIPIYLIVLLLQQLMKLMDIS